MNILVFTTLWPNSEEPNFGVFIKHRAVALSRLEDVTMRVVAPVPYFPRALAGALLPQAWQVKARIKAHESTEGLPVEHPRYLVTPKLGMRYYGRWLAQGAAAVVRRLHEQQPFDLIDAHYIYPDCYAALQLGRALNVPVVMTARGSDINSFTRLKHIRPLIEQTLSAASGIIAVSSGIRREMIALGLPPERIAVIRNGIDRRIFYPRERAAARRALGLDDKRRIIITVGRLEPVKRISDLIGAMARLAQRPDDDGARLYIIGDGTQRAALEAQISSTGLQERVFLIGARLQSELPEWYAAADLFCFASQSEGCPNVLLEALACGLPVVAADAPGIDELITSAACGLLVPSSQSPAEGFAEKLALALETVWDRQAIATQGGARAWEDVALEVKDVLAEAVAWHRSRYVRSNRSHG
jgi:glycosyltransferase involved in cell wall biosynthesis